MIEESNKVPAIVLTDVQYQDIQNGWQSAILYYDRRHPHSDLLLWMQHTFGTDIIALKEENARLTIKFVSCESALLFKLTHLDSL